MASFVPLLTAVKAHGNAGSAVRLGSAVRTTRLPALDDLSPGYSVWQCRQGTFVRYWTMERYSADDSPNLWLWGSDGELALETRVFPPDAHSFVIWDVAVQRLGAVAVSGTAISNNGKTVEAICLLNDAGELEKVVRTSPSVAKRLTFSSDGALWAFGRNLEFDDESADYDVFERFEPDGRRSGSFVPRSTFSNAMSSPAELAGRGGLTWLRASHEFVGAYSGPAAEWIELGLDGRVRGRWSLAAVEGEPARLATLAVTDSGRVFSWKADAGISGLYELDRGVSAWTPVEGTKGEQAHPEIGPLLGSEGEHLVMRGGWRDPSNTSWIAVEDGSPALVAGGDRLHAGSSLFAASGRYEPVPLGRQLWRFC